MTPKFIISSLIILLFISSVGPLSANNISARSQTKRLEKLFIQNNLLNNGIIQISQKDINQEDLKKIGSIIDYLHNYKYYQYMIPWFKNIPNANINSSDKSVQAILKDINLTYVPYERRENAAKKFLSFQAYYLDYEDLYQSDFKISTNFYPSSFFKRVNIEKFNYDITINVDLEKCHYILKINEDSEIVFDLNPFIQQTSDNNQFIVNYKTKDLELKLFIDRLYGTYNKADKFIISEIGSSLFIKKIKN